MTRHLLRRFNVCLLTLIVMIGFTVMVTLTPAYAHSQLIDADPFENEQAERAPEQITLTFNEDIVPMGNEMHVAGPNGETISVGELVVDGPQVIQALADVRPKGAYVVTWRVVSADGHPISGEYIFTASADFPVVEEEDETTDVATTETESADPPQASAPLPTADDTDADADAQESADDSGDSGRSPWRVAIFIVFALGAIGGIVARVVMLRRSK